MKKIIILIVASSVSSQYVYSQGCSDAGFCSIRFHNNKTATNKNIFSIGNVAGIGDENVFINTSYINYTRMYKKGISTDVKITTNYASGSLANHFNAGDIFATAAFPLSKSTATNKLKLSSGLKIPLTSGNDKAGINPLPMTYQSSLGTVDLLAGVNLAVGTQWEFTHSWQIPLTQQNKNSYLQDFGVNKNFPSTNLFSRKADALLRVTYIIHTQKEDFFIKPNLLAIYHVGNDTYINTTNQTTLLQGSQGLTLNANIIGHIPVGKKQSIEISLAAPLVVRDIRPDGLTRSFTAGVEYSFRF